MFWHNIKQTDAAVPCLQHHLNPCIMDDSAMRFAPWRTPSASLIWWRFGTIVSEQMLYNHACNIALIHFQFRWRWRRLLMAICAMDDAFGVIYLMTFWHNGRQIDVAQWCLRHHWAINASMHSFWKTALRAVYDASGVIFLALAKMHIWLQRPTVTKPDQLGPSNFLGR